MKLTRFLPLFLVLVLCSCTPLVRGFNNGALVSPVRPHIMIAVPDMPVLAQGKAMPMVQVDSNYQFPTMVIGVYGTDAQSPMVITSVATVPNDKWEWDQPGFSIPYGVKTKGVVYGGDNFYGKLYIVNSAKDAFAGLVEGDDPQGRWLVQRFETLDDFYQAKIILEYREPIGDAEIDLLPFLDEMKAFTARAEAAFSVSYGSEAGELPKVEQPAWLKSLRNKYLDDFVGSMTSRAEFMINF